MLIKLFPFLMTLFTQGSSDGPPVPKSDGAAPPVGDVVPIDDFIWLLVIVALCIAAYYFYSTHKKVSTI